MERLIQFFLKQKLVVYLCIFLIVIAGVGSLLSFKVSFVPKTNLPWISVNVNGGALPPEEMEEKVTNKIEQDLKGISDIKEYSSSSRTGAVSIDIIAKDGRGTEVKQKVESIVNRHRNSFPKEVTRVEIEQANYGDEEMINIAVVGTEPQTLLNLAKTSIKERIEAVPGVKEAKVFENNFENKITVTLHPEKLIAYQITPQEVIGQLESANWKQAVGTLENAGFNTVVEIDNTFTSIQEISGVTIQTSRGNIALGELANVEDMRGKNTDTLELFAGKPYVHISVKRTEESDVITTQKKVEAVMADINEEAQGAYKLETMYESASFIENSIKNLSSEVIIGGLLAIIVLIFFLKNLRVTLVIATTIPLSALMTFIAMKLFGYEIDAVSLISLSLSVGLIVDAAIVVLESIYHFREKGEPLTRAIVLGTKEVLTPVLSSQLTMIIVFLPLVLADFGEEFKPIFNTIAFTVSAAIISSTIAAFFIVPVISDSFLKHDRQVNLGEEKNKGIGAAITRFFDRVLRLALRHRFKTLAMALLLFVGSFFLTPFIKQGPPLDANENFIFASVVMPKGLTLEAAKQLALEAEQSIKAVPEINKTFLEVNKSNTVMYIELVGKSERSRDKDELTKDINERLKSVKGIDRVELNFGQGSSAPVQLNIKGKDLETASEVTAEVEKMLQTIPGVTNIRNDFSQGSEKITLSPKQDVMERMQVDPRSLLAQLSGFIGEQTVGTMTVDGLDFDITAKYPDSWLKHPDQLDQVMIATQTGNQVPLLDLVDWKYTKTPLRLAHQQGERYIKVSAELVGTDLGKVGAQIDEKLHSLAIPAGYSVEKDGDLKQQSQNLTSGLIVFAGAIALIYVIMVTQFGRFTHPFIIMLTLPMAFIGVVLGLVLTQRSFSLMATVGVTMLIGIVVSNAILLIDRINTLRDRGAELSTAILQGVHDRVRPVLMTKVTAILGMFPMALALSEGSDFNAPLATVVIFGLIVHTLITLVLVPVLYSLFEGFAAWRASRKEARLLKKQLKWAAKAKAAEQSIESN